MKRTTKHLALGAAVLGGAYCLWKRHENPAWTPWASLTSSSRDKALALEKVKVTSVPTPHETAALDPGMSTDQVKQVNASLSQETDMKKLANHAVALGVLGHENSAAAVAAKTVAIAEAKAQGAKDVELHVKQVEAAAVPISPAAVMAGFGGHGWGERGHGWDGRGWDRRGHREPWHEPWGQEIDPATGLPFASEVAVGIQSGPAIVGVQSGPAIVGIQSGPAIVGFDHFGRGGRGREFGRGFGRDPRFPRDRFARRELELEPWRHHHHRQPEYIPQPYAVPEQQAVQQPVPVPVPVAADADANADADTATGWW